MKNLTLSFLLISCLSATSQSSWSLQECINYALNRNINLRQSALNNEINKNNTTQAKGALLPSVNAGASHIYNFGKTIDRFTNTFANTQVLSQNFYLTGNVVLWSGFSQINNIKANEYNYLSGVELVKQQQNDLSLNVANAYIGVIFSEEIMKISQNQYSVTAEQLDRTSKLVEAGSLAKSVEFDIKAQLANELVNVTVAENNFQISVLTLRQLMNLDSISNFVIERPDITVQENQLLENDIQRIYETSLKAQPNIKSTEYSFLSAESSLRTAKGRISPSLSFNANIGTGTSGLDRRIIGFSTASNTLGVIPSFGPVVYETQDPILEKKTICRSV